MAGKSAVLTVKIISDAKGAAQGFNDAESRVAGFQRGVDRASVAAGGLLLGLGAVAVSAFNAASELQQASGALDATFGDAADSMHELARAAAQTTGLAEADYSNMASVIGSQLRNMGVAQAELAPSTDALISKGADLAAQFGGSTSQAVEALSSLLRGERDPIERYGVSISQAAIDAQVMAMGLDTSTEAGKKNAELQATLALLTQQTASATGAFGREADTAAGQQQRMNAELDNAKAKLGEQLLPIVADGAEKLATLAGWVSKNSDLVKTLGIVAGVTAAAVWLLNFAMMANPFVLAVVAIAAVVAALVIAYNKCETFRLAVQRAADVFRGAWAGLGLVFGPILDKIQQIIDACRVAASLISAVLGKGPSVQIGRPLGAAAPGVFGAAPGMYGAAAAATLPGGGTGTARPAVAPAGDTYHVTINGVLDADDAADKISQLLDRRARMTGRALAGAR